MKHEMERTKCALIYRGERLLSAQIVINGLRGGGGLKPFATEG